MLHYHFNLRNGSKLLVGDGMGQAFVRMCSVAALLAMASLPASASPLGAGTRAAVPAEAPLLQEAQCQQVYHLQDRHYVPSVICSPYHPYLMGPASPGPVANAVRVIQSLPSFVPQAALGPVGAPRAEAQRF